MQVPKLMTRGERSDQQFFGIPTLRIATECRIRGACDYRLCDSGGDFVPPLVILVSGSTWAGVAGPAHGHRVAMRFHGCQRIGTLSDRAYRLRLPVLPSGGKVDVAPHDKWPNWVMMQFE